MKSIYSRNCYTYLIGWSTLNKWCYGRQTRKNCKPENLWKTYFTSSEYVKSFRSQHGEPDIVSIKKIFGDDIKKCEFWEDRVLKRLNLAANKNFLNKNNGSDGKFTTTNHAVAIDYITGKKLGLVHVQDPRWTSKEIISHITGYADAIDYITGKKLGLVHVQDPRWTSKEIIRPSLGVSPAIDVFTGERLGRISIDDPRWATKEIVSTSTGNTNNRIACTVNGTCYLSKTHAMKALKVTFNTLKMMMD